jgi:hypothetical protein
VIYLKTKIYHFAGLRKIEKKLNMQILIAGCQYDKGQWGACDESTNEMKRTLTLKEVKDGCDATMEQTRPCKRKQNKQKKSK